MQAELQASTKYGSNDADQFMIALMQEYRMKHSSLPLYLRGDSGLLLWICIRLVRKVTACMRFSCPEGEVLGSGFHETKRVFATDCFCNGAGIQGIIGLFGQKTYSLLNHYIFMELKGTVTLGDIRI